MYHSHFSYGLNIKQDGCVYSTIMSNRWGGEGIPAFAGMMMGVALGSPQPGDVMKDGLSECAPNHVIWGGGKPVPPTLTGWPCLGLGWIRH